MKNLSALLLFAGTAAAHVVDEEPNAAHGIADFFMNPQFVTVVVLGIAIFFAVNHFAIKESKAVKK